VSKREDAEKRITHARTKSKSEVNKILNQTERRVSHNREIISRDIEQQNRRLEDRIHKRRTMSNRSVYSEEEENENEEKHNKYLVRLGVEVEGLGGGETGRGKRVFI
jgi:transcriptional regulator of acetoin/glycerol metabolism